MHDTSFWALKDLDLDIHRGETVGFIGPNGAGKSTLLKLTSRILAPTSGRVNVQGRVAALLELGTGFHPDLTGRENIYLNGSLLGLSKTQINDKLAAIIAFSGLNDFIDVPVKHYSSGMYMRLGFSIAVHVDPDILLVDEVLAVGDNNFQGRCQARIQELVKSGVTILFVSHNLDTVRNICQRVIWMEEGVVRADGAAEWATQVYSDHCWKQREAQLHAKELKDAPGTWDESQRWGSQDLKITQVMLLDGEQRERRSFSTGEPLTIRLDFAASRPVEKPVFGLAIFRSDGLLITGPNTRHAGITIPAVAGNGSVTYSIDTLPLLPGEYDLSVSAYDKTLTLAYDHHHRLYRFLVQGEPSQFGAFAIPGRWSIGAEAETAP